MMKYEKPMFRKRSISGRLKFFHLSYLFGINFFQITTNAALHPLKSVGPHRELFSIPLFIYVISLLQRFSILHIVSQYTEAAILMGAEHERGEARSKNACKEVQYFTERFKGS